MNEIVNRSEKNKNAEFSWLLNNKNNDVLTRQKECLFRQNEISSKIEKLDLSFCSLLKIPHQICQLKFLTILNLSNNRITKIPNEIQNLNNLTYLNLSENKLHSLPKSLKQINQLVNLNLSHNDFAEVPVVLFIGLRNIKILDLSFNKILEFKERPDCFSSLIDLKVSNNFLKSLPKWIFDSLCNIQILDISENLINFDLPSFVTYFNSGIFISIKVLNVGYCNINCESLQFFSHFKRLEVLYLGNKKNSKPYNKNYLGDVDISKFKGSCNLKQLFLENTQVSYLPGTFDQSPNVELLNLSGNLLSWLPDVFCKLSHLIVLDLSSNQLLFLPNDIHLLFSLKYLNLSNNFLYQLPNSFCQLDSLEFVDLYNNKLEMIDYSLLRMKNLKGFDVGMNCLDFEKINFGNGIKVEYNHLKERFREKFNCLSIRSDAQRLDSEEDENEQKFFYSSRHSNSESCSDSEDLSCEYNQEKAPYVEENWEEENFIKTDEDEVFDPNVTKKKLSKSSVLNETVWDTQFRDKFCPADGHVHSIIKTFKRNVLSAIKYESVEEGQFDSE